MPVCIIFLCILGNVTVPISNDNSSSSDSGVIIGGVVGGVILLLMITVVLCIVILCMSRCHRKGTFPVDNKLFFNNTTKLNENVTIDNNPAYDVTKANTVGSLYSTIKPGDSDVPITANPSYNVPTKLYSKAASEDEYLQLNQHSNTIKMDTNPSYGVTIAGEVSAHSDTKAMTKQCDYDYVCEDRLLHQIAAASTTGEAKKDIPASVDQSQYMENVHPVCTADSACPTKQ